MGAPGTVWGSPRPDPTAQPPRGGPATVAIAAITNGNASRQERDSFYRRSERRCDKTFIYFISYRLTGSYGGVRPSQRSWPPPRKLIIEAGENFSFRCDLAGDQSPGAPTLPPRRFLLFSVGPTLGATAAARLTLGASGSGAGCRRGP